ncbi:AlbA family DNA-binding domain-containing protein [Methylorubrum extorquens]|uniref:AlbA family DNA-binding domain-containing protein n=1 Tax=Methylorubrum extorquens TaxID=408 RepID=UPI0020A19103|nr:hypothetical protein [Methylorubrum extorquens]
MRELFDRLIHEGEAGIQRLIQERTQEGLQLDFKQKGRPSHGAFEDNDKKILAKAVSGFANSAGGLIVWGINAEKVDGVDCAQLPAAPIAHIEQFASEATTLVAQLIQPKHDGVHIAPIRSASGDGSGYLLIYVERSERRPHRSEARGQKQYFKRAGDSFFEMEHYDIVDALSRNRTPELDLVISQGGSMPDGENKRLFQFYIGLKNTSDTLAKYPFLIIHDAVNCQIGGMSGEIAGVNQRGMGGNRYFVGGTDYIIHPETELPFAPIGVSLYAGHEGWTLGGIHLVEAVCKIDVTLGCEGARSRRLVFDLYPRDFNIRSH